MFCFQMTINSLTDGLWKYLQCTFNLKPYELGSWNFEWKFTSPNLSRVICHVSPVTCHMSRVTYHMSHVMCNLFIFFSFTKCWSLSVEGLLSTRPTSSSCVILRTISIALCCIGDLLFYIVLVSEHKTYLLLLGQQTFQMKESWWGSWRFACGPGYWRWQAVQGKYSRLELTSTTQWNWIYFDD